MRLSLVVEVGDRVRDGAGESVGVSESAVGELMLLEVAPASFNVVQLRGVFRQPFEGEPGALGERLCGQLAGVDSPAARFIGTPRKRTISAGEVGHGRS